MSGAAPIFLQSTAKLYKNIVDEVCLNAKEAFLDEGIDEAVLREMKQLWESKVLATKAIESFNPQPRPPPTTASSTVSRDLNQQATAFPAYKSNSPLVTSLPTIRTGAPTNVIVRQTAMPTYVLPQQQQHTLITGPTGTFIMPISSAGGTTIMVRNQNPLTGYRVVQVSQLPDAQVRPNLVTGVQTQRNDNASASGNVPQVDGPSGCAASKPKRKTKKQNVILQVDGPGGVSDNEDAVDEDDVPASDDDDIDEDFDQAGYVDEGEPLNSDDDDFVNENADELFEAEDIVVCQFEKVTRAKNKWKFSLKDGVMNLHGKDYVFNKATGESDF